MIYVCNVPGLKKWDEPNQIKNILDDLEVYKNKIVGLELCHNSIGEKCAQALGQKIKNLKYLRQINLSDCFVSRGSEELPKCLKYILESIIDKPIKELNISDNALGPTASSGYEMFFKNNKTLEKLYLNNCGMGPIGTPNLMKILKEKKTLKELKISDNEIDSKGLQLFFDTIKSNENICSIDINNNTLSNKVKTIPEILSTLSNIYHLNLSDLTIEDRNIIKNIFESLPKLNELREFGFEYNISDIDFDEKEKAKFVSDLFECLLKVKNLKEVHLENNDIPKDVYTKYVPQFKKKGLYLFSCYSEEEKENDEIDNEIDMTDLNK